MTKRQERETVAIDRRRGARRDDANREDARRERRQRGGWEAAPVSSRRADLIAVLVLAAAAFLVFANSLHGDFIYDDTKQITGNDLIQDNRHFVRALTSDVWAFKGQRAEAWSSYWRPAFILWLIVNHRMFGLESTVGWHAMSLLLHAA